MDEHTPLRPEDEALSPLPQPDLDVPFESDDLLDDMDEDEDDDDLPDPEDDPNRDYMDDIVIGMPRMCFYTVLIGFGVGVVVCGLAGMVLDREIKAVTMFGLVFAGLGYLVGKQLDKRRLARRAQAQAQLDEKQK